MKWVETSEDVFEAKNRFKIETNGSKTQFILTDAKTGEIFPFDTLVEAMDKGKSLTNR